MRKLKFGIPIFFILITLLLQNSCKKDEKINPYDLLENKPPPDPVNNYNPDPASFAGLHKFIFDPVCANSGCHDGTFEPDFRTPESTYNTLVLRPIIKNNPSGSFTYRVVPGDPDGSVLLNRLTTDIDGQSGIMPLSVDPGSVWEQNKATYISTIRTWIANGAKDLFGNSPTLTNLAPQLAGIFISASGSTNPYPRNIQNGSVVVPPGTASIDVWLSFSDDTTPVEQLSYLKVKTGSSMNVFSTYPELQLNAVTPVIQTGYSGNPVTFKHRLTLQLDGITPLQPQFIRAYVQDDLPAVTEIPQTGSAEHFKRYYSFQIGE
jgi:hypothetical protein